MNVHMSPHMTVILIVALVLGAVAAEMAWRLFRPQHGRHVPGAPPAAAARAPRPADSTDQMPAIRIRPGGHQPGSNAATAVWQPRAAPLSAEAIDWRVLELHSRWPHLFDDDWAVNTEVALLTHFDGLRAQLDGWAAAVLAGEVLEVA